MPRYSKAELLTHRPSCPRPSIPAFQDLLRWATVEQPALVGQRARAALRDRILASPRGADLLERFTALEAAPDVVRVGREPWFSH